MEIRQKKKGIKIYVYIRKKDKKKSKMAASKKKGAFQISIFFTKISGMFGINSVTSVLTHNFNGDEAKK